MSGREEVDAQSSHGFGGGRQVELNGLGQGFRDGLEAGAAAGGAEALAGYFFERVKEGERGFGGQVKQVEMEVEGLTGGEGMAVEVASPEDERPGQVGEAAGRWAFGLGIEQAGVERGGHDLAGDGAECTAQDIGGFAWGEVDGIEGCEFEAKRADGEIHSVTILGQASNSTPGRLARSSARSQWYGVRAVTRLVPKAPPERGGGVQNDNPT